MRSNVYHSSIDAFLLTVDFSKLNAAWFAQFDKGGTPSEEIQKLLESCTTDCGNFNQSVRSNRPPEIALMRIDKEDILKDIKSRIKSHKQKFDAVVSDIKKINFQTDVTT